MLRRPPGADLAELMPQDSSAMATSAASAAVWLGCECCGLVSAGVADQPTTCTRCGHRLYWRKPFSLQRTWACLVAAAVLYVPANVLPVMHSTQAFRSSEHTLLGGIAELWHEGAYFLSLIVFIASIVVPLLKIGAMGLLAWSVHYAPQWRQADRARMYTMIEAVGHWSMLDVYVVVLVGGMVRFSALASAEPGPGLLAFAAVVVLTMLAAQVFDPRLIWQVPERHG